MIVLLSPIFACHSQREAHSKSMLLIFISYSKGCSKDLQTQEFYQDFTIDHKKSWYNNPKLFWDLNNIAFSHLKCNSAYTSNNKRAQHGSETKYRSGCRCPKCVQKHINDGIKYRIGLKKLMNDVVADERLP